MVFAGSWRFLLSTSYRRKKLAEWRAARGTLGGKLMIAVEIVAATVIGMLLPLWLLAATLASR